MKLQNKNMKKYMAETFLVFLFVFSAVRSVGVYAADVTSSTLPKVQPAQKSQSAPKTQEVTFAQKVKESLSKKSIDETLQLFETMPDSMKSNPDMLILKASIMLSGNKLQEVSEVLAKLDEIAPDNRDAAELSIMVARFTGDKVKLRTKVQQLLASDPNNDLANIELAEDALRTNNYKGAVSFYQKALEGNPQSEEAMLGLGQCYYYLVKPESAKKYLDMLLEKDDMNAGANLYYGKLAAEESRYRAALKYVEKAQISDPENLDVYLDLGSYRHRLMDNAGAEKAWTKAIEIAPNFFLTYAYRASLYEEMSRFADAYNDYKKVVELNPKYYYAFEAMGMLAWHEKDYAGAYNAFAKSLESSPDNFSYTMMLAACLLKAEKKNQVKLLLEKLMKKLNRESIEYYIARLYHDGGGVNAENTTLLKVKREESPSKRGKFLFYMGLFYELNNFKERAAGFYQQTLEVSPPLYFEYRLAEWGKEDEQQN